MANYYVREEDGTSKYILESGSGDLLVEDVPEIHPGFIGSVTQTNGVVLQTSPMVFRATGPYAVPAGVTVLFVEAWGGGGNGVRDPWGTGNGGAGGGGGAYSSGTVAVTPGSLYTVTVGAAAGDSSFVGDAGATILAKGGQNANIGSNPNTAPGLGGAAASGTGTTKFSGGDGSTHDPSLEGGGGGGAAGSTGNGGASGPASFVGGIGNDGGGNGGDGGTGPNGGNGFPGVVPGGAGGGGWLNVGDSGPGAGGQVIVYVPFITAPTIPSITQVYTPVTQGSIADFTSSGVWVCPPGITTILAQAWGGGGGGAAAQHFGAGGGGGGGGAFSSGPLTVTPGTTYTVTVGAGGAAVPFGDNNGNDGTDSNMTGDSASVTAKAGLGGTTAISGHSTGGAGGLASASTGTITFDGGSGGGVGGGGFNSGGGGGGGGAGSAGAGSNGAPVTGTGGSSGGAGGTPDGGAGGGGGTGHVSAGIPGTAPGGGGGASGYQVTQGEAGARGRVVVSYEVVFPTFIPSVTQVYAAAAQGSTTDFSSSGTWTCPPGVTSIYVKAWAGGGAGNGSGIAGGAGGGGGAFAAATVAVTPGTTYTVTVGTGGTTLGTNGNDSIFVGDSSSVIAKGGVAGGTTAGGTGGQASASTGTTKNSGGSGGAVVGGGAAAAGGGGGAGDSADGSVGATTSGIGPNPGGAGGSAGGGAGGSGTNSFSNTPAGAYGGGGAGRPGVSPSFSGGADGHVTIYVNTVNTPFIPSVTQVYAPTLILAVGFIASRTVVYPIFSVFANVNSTTPGPGNGGETSLLQLAPNGTTETPTLSAAYSGGVLHLTGDGGLPSSGSFALTIDGEVLIATQVSAGLYNVLQRAVANTTAANHLIGATATWSDSYDQSVGATSAIASTFTANISGTGSHTYPGWLICFDSTQAYLGASRYPLHVAEVLGVFAAGAGSTGTNRCDAAQPNAVSTAVGVSDDCGASLSNPSRIDTDILSSDVALVRFTNPEASILTLGPRAVSLQSWFGLKRVDALDNDVTFTDPNGYVIDTNPGTGRFAADANEQFFNPLTTGIAPDTGLPSDRPIAYTSTTLTGTLRYFTFGPPHYNEKGWPIACMSVRNEFRRVPKWASFDWHNFNYIYTGFGTDCVYAQLVINRNGIDSYTTPIINLPGPQDIHGSDAMWDDGSYHFGVSFYVAIFSGPYIVVGPSIGGSPEQFPILPSVGFPGGGGGAPGPPLVVVPGAPPTEGGSGGGNIPPPPPPTGAQRFLAQLV